MSNTIKAILTVHTFDGSMMESASSTDYSFDDVDYAKKVERELNDAFAARDIDAYAFLHILDKCPLNPATKDIINNFIDY